MVIWSLNSIQLNFLMALVQTWVCQKWNFSWSKPKPETTLQYILLPLDPSESFFLRYFFLAPYPIVSHKNLQIGGGLQTSVQILNFLATTQK